MPYGDRRGPEGMGPRTGRGLGLCNGYSTPGYLNDFGYGRGRGAGFAHAGYGRGFGYGRGLGLGYGRGYTARPAVSKEDEKGILESEIKRLSDELESLKNRLSSLNE